MYCCCFIKKALHVLRYYISCSHVPGRELCTIYSRHGNGFTSIIIDVKQYYIETFILSVNGHVVRFLVQFNKCNTNAVYYTNERDVVYSYGQMSHYIQTKPASIRK